jgi:hypothetical protein
MRNGRCQTRNRQLRSCRTAVSTVLVALTLLAKGCSFALIERAPDEGYARETHVGCTSSYGLPVLDTVITAGAAGGAVASFAKEPSDDGVSKAPYILLGVAAVVAAVPFLMSAAYGYAEVADCNAAAARSVEPVLREHPSRRSARLADR